MKYFLLIAIKCYWLIFPANKRRMCLFKKSCSRFVYENTLKYGFVSGSKALWYRYKTCRPGYIIYVNKHTNSTEVILCNHETIPADDVSLTILQHLPSVT